MSCSGICPARLHCECKHPDLDSRVFNPWVRPSPLCPRAALPQFVYASLKAIGYGLRHDGRALGTEVHAVIECMNEGLTRRFHTGRVSLERAVEIVRRDLDESGWSRTATGPPPPPPVAGSSTSAVAVTPATAIGQVCENRLATQTLPDAPQPRKQKPPKPTLAGRRKSGRRLQIDQTLFVVEVSPLLPRLDDRFALIEDSLNIVV